MKIFLLTFLAVLGCLPGHAQVQDTNALKTTLGVYEAQTGVMLIKGFAAAGSVSAGNVAIDLNIKQTQNAGTGEKVYGLSFNITGSMPFRERVLVDDDEVDALLNSINYLLKVNYQVTALPSFEATYSTKAGLRFIAEGQPREGVVQFFLQYDINPRISLTSMQLTQLGEMIEQARKTIASLKDSKQAARFRRAPAADFVTAMSR